MSNSLSEKSQHKTCCMCDGSVKENYNDSLLSQITTYFLGVKILEFSTNRCFDLLQNEGNPICWFDFCEKCFKKVNDAEKTFKQLLKLESEWKSLKEKIRRQINKCSYNKSRHLQHRDKQEKIYYNTEESSDYIKIENFEDEVKIEDEELISPEYVACDEDYISFDDDDEYSPGPYEIGDIDCDPLRIENPSVGDDLSVGRCKRSRNFTLKETKTLLEIWSLDKFQAQFLKTKKHGPIWNQITFRLFKAGKQNDKSQEFPNREPREVQNRIKNIKKLYMATKRNDPNVSKNGFPFYEIMEKTFEKHPLLATIPIESIEDVEDIESLDEAPLIQTKVKRCPNFTQEETVVMLRLWGSDEFQTQFQKSKRSILIWNMIAIRLFETGKKMRPRRPFPERDGYEIQNRFKNVKRTYVAIRNNTDPSISKEDFPYFAIFDTTYEKIEKHLLSYASVQHPGSEETVDETPAPRDISNQKSKRIRNFTENETKALLQIWSSEKIQENFRNSRKSILVWDIIAKQLFESGKQNPLELQFPQRQALEVQNRFKNVKRKYTDLKPNSNTDDFPYYIFFKNTWERMNANNELKGLTCYVEPQKDSSKLQTTHNFTLNSKSEVNAQSKDEISSEMRAFEEPKEPITRVKAQRKSKHFSVPISEEDDIKFEKSTDFGERDAYEENQISDSDIKSSASEEIKPNEESRSIRRGQRCPNFTPEETKALMKIWGTKEFQLKFRKSKKHVSIWGEIAFELFKVGNQAGRKPRFPKRNFSVVLNKVRNLKRIYTAIKTGELENDEFPYYELFAKIDDDFHVEEDKGKIKDKIMMAKRNRGFTKEEMKAMLEILSSDEYQTQLKSKGRNSLIWNLIAAQLYEVGKQNPVDRQFPERKGSEVRTRFGTLKRKCSGVDNDSHVDPDQYLYYQYFEKAVKSDNETGDESDTMRADGLKSKNNFPHPNDTERKTVTSLQSYLIKGTRRCPNFTQEETKIFLQIFVDDGIQVQLEKSKGHRLIWNKVAAKLFDAGKQDDKRPRFPRRGYLEVQNKFQNLKRTFALIESDNPTIKKEDFPLYDDLTRVFGCQSSQNLPVQNSGKVNDEQVSNCKERQQLNPSSDEINQESHGDNATSKKSWNCQKCTKECKSLGELKSHIFTTHGKIIRCNLCEGLSFSTNLKLIAHVKVVHKGVDNPFLCGLCNKAFPSLVSLRKHEQGSVHNTYRKYQCECGKTFPRKRYLLNHEAIVHRGERNFVCELCGDSFTSNQYLKYHKMSKHNLEESPSLSVKCDQCGKILSDPISLRHHIQSVHQGIYKFHCEICNAGRRSKSAIDKHIISAHTNRRPYVCNVCQKSYADKAALTVHMRLHSGKNLFQCKECNKSFISRGHLKRHADVHVVDKTFKCELCQKAFASSRYLRSHHKHAHRKPKKVIERVVVDETKLLQMVGNGAFPRTENALKNSVAR